MNKIVCVNPPKFVKYILRLIFGKKSSKRSDT